MHVLQILIGIFAVLGAADRITGNHLKLGQEFEKGIMATGSLALAMVGMIVLSPVISELLTPIVEPVSAFLGIDPSFISIFFANDMGGASLAEQLSPGTVWSGINGLVVSSMLGVTLCFTIPVPLKLIDPKHHRDVLSGILCGIVTMPIGCIVGGLVLGCPFPQLMRNLLPVIMIAALVCIGLVLNAELCRKLFALLGDAVLIVITVGLAAGIWEYLTGMMLIPRMGSISEAFGSVIGIAITLAGVFPMLKVISQILYKLLNRAGKALHINSTSVMGLITSLSNSIPMFSMVEEMDSRGIVINMAFAVSASFVFGDHLAFTMAYNDAYLAGMIAGKLTGGLCAILAAVILNRYMHSDEAAALSDRTGEEL